MKKWIIGLTALVIGVGVAQAALQANVYHGNANDSDFNNAVNWWNPVTANDNMFLRGDNIATFPGRANINLSAPSTVTRINYEGTYLASAAYNITGTGGALTIDAVPENNTTQLIDVFSAVTVNQTIGADLVLKTASNANQAHVKTGAGAGLILSGNVSQASTSQGLGFSIGNGDVEIAGSVGGPGKLWKVRDNGGTGVLNVTGTWSGGTLQIDANTGVLLNRSSADSTALSGLFLQLVGGDLTLGNDEQMGNTVTLSFSATSAGTFNLDGHTETIGGLNFTAVSGQAGALDMGLGGILHLTAQDDAAKWGTLNVLNWNSGEDHIYVDGGSFSSAQLAGITFDNWEPSGAKVELGELLPTGTDTSASAYETWAADFGVGDGTNDFDADGLLNIYEYGLGGDPTNEFDQGTSPVFGIQNVGGTNYFGYVYPQLSDANSGLSYYLEITADLAFPAWTNAGYAVMGTNVTGNSLDFVTNATTTVEGKKFIRLIIESL